MMADICTVHIQQRREVPSELAGYMVHIRLKLPGSKLVDVMGVCAPATPLLNH